MVVSRRSGIPGLCCVAMATASPAMVARAVLVGGNAMVDPDHSRACQMCNRSRCVPAASRNGNFFRSKFGQIRAFPATRRGRRGNKGLNGLQVLNCLIPGVDGGFWEDSDDGGVSDDYVSTRRGRYRKEFCVLANMLRQIEPLDTSVIGKGASANAKDSMKRTISGMLGVLPFDNFHVTVRVSRQPLARLLVSSMMTGYTLWNAEYRVSLQRIFDLPAEGIKRTSSQRSEAPSFENRELEASNSDEFHSSINEFSGVSGTPGELGHLTPEALNYIKHLESKLSDVRKELDDHKQRNVHIEKDEENNDLLDYLRSLEPDMVTELSRPSSPEVEKIVQEIVQNLLHIFFADDTSVSLLLDEPDDVRRDNNLAESADSLSQSWASVTASRNYLARLLFWCVYLPLLATNIDCKHVFDILYIDIVFVRGFQVAVQIYCSKCDRLLNPTLLVHAFGSPHEKLGVQITA